MFLSDVVLIILFCSEGHGGRKVSVCVGIEKCRLSGGRRGGGGWEREGKESNLSNGYVPFFFVLLFLFLFWNRRLPKMAVA